MENRPHLNDPWQQCESNHFWDEVAPCQHVVQIYETETVFIDLLENYVTGGLKAGNAVVLILTEKHRHELCQRLYARNISVSDLAATKDLIMVDVEEALEKFMVADWPDEQLFKKMVNELIVSAKEKGKTVRAFGEMVAVLWAQGNKAATMQVERLWNRFCEKENFTLFCAYPESGFTEHADQAIMHICGKHTKMVSSVTQSHTELKYRSGALKMVG
jgi:hypothetical protein